MKSEKTHLRNSLDLLWEEEEKINKKIEFKKQEIINLQKCIKEIRDKQYAIYDKINEIQEVEKEALIKKRLAKWVVKEKLSYSGRCLIFESRKFARMAEVHQDEENPKSCWAVKFFEREYDESDHSKIKRKKFYSYCQNLNFDTKEKARKYALEWCVGPFPSEMELY